MLVLWQMLFVKDFFLKKNIKWQLPGAPSKKNVLVQNKENKKVPGYVSELPTLGS